MTLLRRPLAVSGVLSALLLSAPAASAAAAGPLPTTSPGSAGARAPGLSPQQESEVLQLIDNACGDAWCEGDHDWRFLDLSAIPGRHASRLTVEAALWSEPDSMHWYRRSVRIPGYVWYRQMVTADPVGGPELDWDFYLAVGDALERVEATLPERRLASPGDQ